MGKVSNSLSVARKSKKREGGRGRIKGGEALHVRGCGGGGVSEGATEGFQGH